MFWRDCFPRAKTLLIRRKEFEATLFVHEAADSDASAGCHAVTRMGLPEQVDRLKEKRPGLRPAPRQGPSPWTSSKESPRDGFSKVRPLAKARKAEPAKGPSSGFQGKILTVFLQMPAGPPGLAIRRWFRYLTITLKFSAATTGGGLAGPPFLLWKILMTPRR